MGSKSQVDELEVKIREIIRQLLELAVSPQVRELRAKAVTYGRVIGGWGHYPPTGPQFTAMADCVTELEERLQELAAEANGDPRESGQMPTGRGARPILSPPPPPLRAPSPPPAPTAKDLSEFDAFEAALRADADQEVDVSGVRSRNVPQARRTSSAPPSRRAEVSPAPPPKDAAAKAKATTQPSRRRPASDTRPTPVPALLQTRRSR